jgi:CxxC-x17-CxxC domain-containing protein
MFQDQEITCGECGTRFGFSSEEQSFYAEKGLNHPPRRCKACRLARKQQHGSAGAGQPASGGRRDRPTAPPSAGGPFVRRSRQNSHGDHENLPWHRGGTDRNAAGVWQPRHGKGPWAANGWQAQPRRDASPERGGGGASRDGRGPRHSARGTERGGTERGGRGHDRNRESGNGAPLFKANFGPQPGGQESRGDGRRGNWQDQGRNESGGGNRRQDAAGVNRRQPRGGPVGGRQERGPLVLHDAVCSDCSAETQVPFKPHHKLPVFCRTCLPKHKQRKSPPQGPSTGRS